MKIDTGPWEREPMGGKSRPVSYKARFWEAPCEAGESGRYVTQACQDRQFVRRDGSVTFLNTAPSVSYYSELRRACNA